VALLGFDTSLPTTSACVLADGDRITRSAPPPIERLLGPAGHSQELLPELERLLSEAGCDWGELESIAVGVGPGTFTGLRIGISTARSLAQALAIRVRPVSSLAALAAGAAGERSTLALIDARRGQVFAGLYEPDGGDRATGIRAVWEPAVLDPDQLLSQVSTLAEPPLAVGDWALRFRAELEGAGADVAPYESGLHAIDGFQVCRLGKDVTPVPPDTVYPIYLRLPDAELNAQRRRSAKR
jgi:tRNA threonylcarbamoyladenosine biosynthesis protein TsaB